MPPTKTTKFGEQSNHSSANADNSGLQPTTAGDLKRKRVSTSKKSQLQLHTSTTSGQSKTPHTPTHSSFSQTAESSRPRRTAKSIYDEFPSDSPSPKANRRQSNVNSSALRKSTSKKKKSTEKKKQPASSKPPIFSKVKLPSPIGSSEAENEDRKAKISAPPGYKFLEPISPPRDLNTSWSLEEDEEEDSAQIRGKGGKLGWGEQGAEQNKDEDQADEGSPVLAATEVESELSPLSSVSDRATPEPQQEPDQDSPPAKRRRLSEDKEQDIVSEHAAKCEVQDMSLEASQPVVVNVIIEPDGVMSGIEEDAFKEDSTATVSLEQEASETMEQEDMEIGLVDEDRFNSLGEANQLALSRRSAEPIVGEDVEMKDVSDEKANTSESAESGPMEQDKIEPLVDVSPASPAHLQATASPLPTKDAEQQAEASVTEEDQDEHSNNVDDTDTSPSTSFATKSSYIDSIENTTQHDEVVEDLRGAGQDDSEPSVIIASTLSLNEVIVKELPAPEVEGQQENEEVAMNEYSTTATSEVAASLDNEEIEVPDNVALVTEQKSSGREESEQQADASVSLSNLPPINTEEQAADATGTALIDNEDNGVEIIIDSDDDKSIEKPRALTLGEGQVNGCDGEPLCKSLTDSSIAITNGGEGEQDELIEMDMEEDNGTTTEVDTALHTKDIDALSLDDNTSRNTFSVALPKEDVEIDNVQASSVSHERFQENQRNDDQVELPTPAKEQSHEELTGDDNIAKENPCDVLISVSPENIGKEDTEADQSESMQNSCGTEERESDDTQVPMILKETPHAEADSIGLSPPVMEVPSFVSDDMKENYQEISSQKVEQDLSEPNSYTVPEPGQPESEVSMDDKMDIEAEDLYISNTSFPVPAQLVENEGISSSSQEKAAAVGFAQVQLNEAPAETRTETQQFEAFKQKQTEPVTQITGTPETEPGNEEEQTHQPETSMEEEELCIVDADEHFTLEPDVTIEGETFAEIGDKVSEISEEIQTQEKTNQPAVNPDAAIGEQQESYHEMEMDTEEQAPESLGKEPPPALRPEDDLGRDDYITESDSDYSILSASSGLETDDEYDNRRQCADGTKRKRKRRRRREAVSNTPRIVGDIIGSPQEIVVFPPMHPMWAEGQEGQASAESIEERIPPAEKENTQLEQPGAAAGSDAVTDIATEEGFMSPAETESETDEEQTTSESVIEDNDDAGLPPDFSDSDTEESAFDFPSPASMPEDPISKNSGILELAAAAKFVEFTDTLRTRKPRDRIIVSRTYDMFGDTWEKIPLAQNEIFLAQPSKWQPGLDNTRYPEDALSIKEWDGLNLDVCPECGENYGPRISDANYQKSVACAKHGTSHSLESVDKARRITLCVKLPNGEWHPREPGKTNSTPSSPGGHLSLPVASQENSEIQPDSSQRSPQRHFIGPPAYEYDANNGDDEMAEPDPPLPASKLFMKITPFETFESRMKAACEVGYEAIYFEQESLVDAMQQLQFEYLEIEKEISRRSRRESKGIKPADSYVIFEDKKEADLYNYKYDPAPSRRGLQDPDSQRTDSVYIGGRELRGRARHRGSPAVAVLKSPKRRGPAAAPNAKVSESRRGRPSKIMQTASTPNQASRNPSPSPVVSPPPLSPPKPKRGRKPSKPTPAMADKTPQAEGSQPLKKTPLRSGLRSRVINRSNLAAVSTPDSPETPSPPVQPASAPPVPETPVIETPAPQTPAPQSPVPQSPAPPSPVPLSPAPQSPPQQSSPSQLAAKQTPVQLEKPVTRAQTTKSLNKRGPKTTNSTALKPAKPERVSKPAKPSKYAKPSTLRRRSLRRAGEDVKTQESELVSPGPAEELSTTQAVPEEAPVTNPAEETSLLPQLEAPELSEPSLKVTLRVSRIGAEKIARILSEPPQDKQQTGQSQSPSFTPINVPDATAVSVSRTSPSPPPTPTPAVPAPPTPTPKTPVILPTPIIPARQYFGGKRNRRPGTEFINRGVAGHMSTATSTQPLTNRITTAPASALSATGSNAMGLSGVVATPGSPAMAAGPTMQTISFGAQVPSSSSAKGKGKARNSNVGVFKSKPKLSVFLPTLTPATFPTRKNRACRVYSPDTDGDVLSASAEASSGQAAQTGFQAFQLQSNPCTPSRPSSSSGTPSVNPGATPRTEFARSPAPDVLPHLELHEAPVGFDLGPRKRALSVNTPTSEPKRTRSSEELMHTIPPGGFAIGGGLNALPSLMPNPIPKLPVGRLAMPVYHQYPHFSPGPIFPAAYPLQYTNPPHPPMAPHPGTQIGPFGPIHAPGPMGSLSGRSMGPLSPPHAIPLPSILNHPPVELTHKPPLPPHPPHNPWNPPS